MAQDRDANLWVGTDSRGVLRINAHGVSSLPDDANQPGGAVTAVFEDREGNIWIGRANGLERIRDSTFLTYSPAEGLPTDGNVPVFVDSESRTWFAPATGGLWWLKGGLSGRVSRDGLDRDVIYSIDGGGGELWLGRKRGGLTRLRAEAATTYTEADGLAQDSVFSVHRTRSGGVWAGTLSGGVSRLENGKITTYTSASGLASNTVSSILETSGGTMWFATPNGLSKLEKDQWQTFTIKDGLPSDYIHSLHEDSKGVLWVGTASGLAFLGPNGFQHPWAAGTSLREQILGIQEDRLGSLWVATIAMC
jgi:ligand-binding sensor domain-containing protein